MRSAPQKQPMPKIALSVPSGNGGSSGVPSTKWLEGTAIRCSRPGRASSFEVMAVFLLSRKLMVLSRVAPRRYGSAMAAVEELRLPEFDYLDTELRGERFHRTMIELARESWLVKSDLGYFVLDRESAAFFLRTKSATFPGMKIAELFEVEDGPLYEEMRRNILHINGDAHRRLRNLVNPAFTPR